MKKVGRFTGDDRLVHEQCPYCHSYDIGRLYSRHYWFCYDCRRLLWEYPDEKKEEKPSPPDSKKSGWSGE